MLFRGYIETVNKKSKMSFKGKTREQLLTYEQVKDLPEYAGVLDDETILVDIDDKRQGRLLFDLVKQMNLKCQVRETDNGFHFYFKNTKIKKCYTKTTVARGFTVDIKVGFKNSYAVLKKEGKERSIVYDTDSYEEVPNWLYPVDGDFKFYLLDAGDGRNNKLFTFIIPLQKLGFDKETIREYIKYINSYILKSPVDKTELDVILRDDSFETNISKSFIENNNFLFDEFAKELIDKFNIIKINDQLHIYKDGVYVNSTKQIERKMIELIPRLSQTRRKEVLSYLSVYIEEDSTIADARYIAFNNGIYDIVTEELLPLTPDIIITNKIPHNYNKDAYSAICDKSLNQYACNDGAVRRLLEEVVGYTFYRRNELRRSFLLLGDKANGKSTYLHMIQHLLGEDNTCALDLKEIGDKFRTAAVFGKLCNIGDDISGEYIPDLSTFRKVVSGDKVTVERKGQDPFEFYSYCKFLFSANEIPRTKDPTGSNINRMIIVPFLASFDVTKPDFDPFIKYKLLTEEVMEYLIVLGLKGLKRVLNEHKFTTTRAMEEEKKEYEMLNNPILSFYETFDNFENNSVDYCFEKYLAFCVRDNLQPMTKITFSKTIRKDFQLETKVLKIDGKSQRVFKKA